MTRRCNGTAAAAQSAPCGDDAQDEMTMCHYGAAVEPEGCTDVRRQLQELNATMSEISDTLELILQAMQPPQVEAE